MKEGSYLAQPEKAYRLVDALEAFVGKGTGRWICRFGIISCTIIRRWR